MTCLDAAMCFLLLLVTGCTGNTVIVDVEIHTEDRVEVVGNEAALEGGL